MKKTTLFFLIGFLAIAVPSCGKKEDVEKPPKIPTVKGVSSEVLKAATVGDFYEAVGTVRSKITSVLSSRMTGSILAFHVREGDPVKAGQLLVEIDDRDLHIQLGKAQAGLREAQDRVDEIERNIQSAESAKTAAEAEQNLSLVTYNRYKTLLEKKSVSQQEFDQVEARYRARTAELERANAQVKSLLARREQVLAKIEQAKAEVSTAQIFIGYARIQSPINGIVAVKQTDVGALAAPGVPLLTIEDNSHYRLEAAVEESMIGKIRLGDSAGVRIDAFGSLEWNGKVVEISPSSDPGSRSVMVKIDLVPKDKKMAPRPFLRSGLFGKVRFLSGERTLVTIPARAILPRGQLQGVYVVDSTNIARFRLIQVGKFYGDRIEVLSGLREGERILVEGLEKVQDGRRIEG
jgi:multidrug efflux pump subunit AcrA (membrane-fusion protein)